MIFYGKDGLPIHSDAGVYGEGIMGHLAKLVEGGLNTTRDAPGVSYEVRKQADKVEVRVLNYQIIR